MPWAPNPPRDAAGNVLPHDDQQSIPDGWTLLRHIHPEHWTVDQKTGLPRAQSNAFMFSSSGSGSMSVDLEQPMLEAGLAATHYASLAGKGLVRFAAAVTRSQAFRVGPEPVPGNDYHAGIWPPNEDVGPNELRKRQRALSREAEFVSCGPENEGPQAG